MSRRGVDALGSGTSVITNDLRVTIAVNDMSEGRADIEVSVTHLVGTPVANSKMVVFSEMAGMEMHREESIANKAVPGRCVARDVPLDMPGAWQLAVRVSPRGAATARFFVEMER